MEPPSFVQTPAHLESYTPTKTYPCYSSPVSGRIRAAFTPGAKGIKSVIYRIKYCGPSNQVKRYVGQTANFVKRISAHFSRANNSEKNPLSNDLRRSPARFNVGIIQTVNPEKRDDAEKAVITALGTTRLGYNRRNGGGGGKPQPNATLPMAVQESVFRVLKRNYTDPKHYPFISLNGRVSHKIPRKILRLKHRAYDIMRTAPDGARTHYIGYTSSSIAKRLYPHISYANHPDKAPLSFYQDLHRHPEEFTFAVLKTNFLRRLHLPLPYVEELYTRFYQWRGEALFNKTRGRNGSWSAQ